MRSVQQISLSLTVLAVASCADVPSAPGGTATDYASPRVTNSRSASAVGPEARWYRLAKQISGFGGYFYDRSGNMHVYLTDLRKTGEARSTLESFLRARPRDYITEPGGKPRIIVHRGRYDFPQLAKWRNLVGQHVAGKPSVSSFGVDIAHNAVVVGVTIPDIGAAEAYVRNLLSGVQVPPEAVRVAVRAARVPGATLSSRRDTLEGGLKTGATFSSLNWPCSLGFNAQADDGTRVFVTASHCTNTRGGVEGTVFWQPYPPDREIGTEYRDPAWLPYPQIADCPNAQVNGQQIVCRYSDAALIRYHPSMITRPSIARTTFNSTGAGNFGSTTIDPITSNLPITQTRAFPDVGDPVQKVGFVSGWTWAYTTNNCINRQVTTEDGSALTRYYLLCQADIDDAASASGDSGAPAFLLRDNGSGSYVAQLTGVVWGVDPTGFTISSLDYIEYELGPLFVF
jgi:hypothetical protein